MKTSTLIILVVAGLGTLWLLKDSLFSKPPAPAQSPTLNKTGGGSIPALGDIASITTAVASVLNKLPSIGQSNAQTLSA